MSIYYLHYYNYHNKPLTPTITFYLILIGMIINILFWEHRQCRPAHRHVKRGVIRTVYSGLYTYLHTIWDVLGPPRVSGHAQSRM
jgi:hypothetical protein